MESGVLEKNVSCDSVLVKGLSILNESREVRLAWLKFVNQSNYEESKQSTGGQAYAGMFSGDFNNFDQKRNALMVQERFDYSDIEVRQTLISRVPPDAVRAWRDCVITKMEAESLACWFEQVTSESAVLFIRWKLGRTAMLLHDIKVTLTGATDFQGRSTIALDPLTNEASFHIKRKSKHGAVSGSVTGKAGNASFASSFGIPADEDRTVFNYTNDVKAYGEVRMSVGPYPRAATVQLTLTNSAIWNHSGDPQFGYNLFYPVNQKLAGGPFGLSQDHGARTETATVTFRLAAGQVAAPLATTWNHHADCDDLRFDATVTLDKEP